MNLNLNYNLVGFCGRIGSGKSTISKIFIDHGYQKISFADPLKDLVCQLLSINMDTLNNNKMVEMEYKIHDTDMIFISNETGIPYEHINSMLSSINYVFHSIRDMLQFIGTNIIRKYNPNWHVDKIKNRINVNEKYVIDDCRFPNEKQMIESLGGTLWYIVRPKLNNISNHESETSIRWQEIDDVYINDSNEEKLITDWMRFLQNGYENGYKERYKILKKLQNNKFKRYLCFLSNLYFEHLRKKTFIHRDAYDYDFKNFATYQTAEIISTDTKDCVKLISHDNQVEYVNNSLIIEDFKPFIWLSKK